MIDKTKLKRLAGKALGDVGATRNAVLIVLGDRLHLFKTLADHGPTTSRDLASRTGTSELHVREWLSAQAASGFVERDSETDEFSMSPEQVMLFADDDSPMFMVGRFDRAVAGIRAESKLLDAFRSGAGSDWLLRI